MIIISDGGSRRGFDAIRMAMLRMQNIKPIGPITSITVV
jgi:hypothetical protein